MQLLIATFAEALRALSLPSPSLFPPSTDAHSTAGFFCTGRLSYMRDGPVVGLPVSVSSVLTSTTHTLPVTSVIMVLEVTGLPGGLRCSLGLRAQLHSRWVPDLMVPFGFLSARLDRAPHSAYRFR